MWVHTFTPSGENAEDLRSSVHVGALRARFFFLPFDSTDRMGEIWGRGGNAMKLFAHVITAVHHQVSKAKSERDTSNSTDWPYWINHLTELTPALAPEKTPFFFQMSAIHNALKSISVLSWHYRFLLFQSMAWSLLKALCIDTSLKCILRKRENNGVETEGGVGDG